MDDSTPGSSVHGIFPSKNAEVGNPSPEDLPNPGIDPGSPALQADSLLTWVTREALLYIHQPEYVYLLTILQVIIIFTTV